MIGMTMTTFTSPTPTTVITYTTAGIPTSELRSASRCSGERGAASGEAVPLMNSRQGANHARIHIDRYPGISTSRGAAPVVAQQNLGLCPDRRSRVNSPGCCRSPGSRTHLSHVAHLYYVDRRQRR